MSIVAFPYGLLSSGKRSSGYNSQGYETIPIASGYNTELNFGDVVKLDTNGQIVKDTGTTALTPMGVFVGCEYTDGNGRKQWAQKWTAGLVTADARAHVETDPLSVWQIQADGPVSQAAVGANAAIVQTAGALGRSKNALQASSIATTSTLPLRIVGIVNRPDNAPGDLFTDVLVVFNNHQLTTLTGI